jgi:hypothetical protein
MGLLDDAIREHLELKRLHGASDEEIAQQEAEALGPARRDFPQPPADEMEAGEVQGAELQNAEPELAAEPADAAEDPLPEATEDLPTMVEPPPFETVLEPESEPAPEPEPDPEPEPKQEPETRNSTLETDDAGRSDDDVLEETPEFLQDAPEHDRLWFEQKPPRDFDFD